MKKIILCFWLMFLFACNKNEVVNSLDFQSSSWENLKFGGIYNDFFECINDSVKIASVYDEDSTNHLVNYIYLTKDNCKTWTKLKSNVAIGKIRSHKNGYVTVNFNGTYISTNLVNWDKITPPTAYVNANVYSNIISNQGKIFVNFDKLFSSENDGNTWKEELDDIYYIRSINKTLFVEHNVSNAYDYSFDNGNTWHRDSFIGDLDFSFSDAVLTEEGVYAISRHSDSIIFSNYSFTDWKVVSKIPNNRNAYIFKVGKYFILCGTTYYYSKDNCISWKKFDRPNNVEYYVESEGYIYGYNKSYLLRKKIF